MTPPLFLQPPVAVVQSLEFEPLNLFQHFVSLEWDFVRLLGLGPEVGNGEFAVEIRAEVVHYADGEQDIHAKLESFSTDNTNERGIPTLATSRLMPPMLSPMAELMYFDIDNDESYAQLLSLVAALTRR